MKYIGHMSHVCINKILDEDGLFPLIRGIKGRDAFAHQNSNTKFVIYTINK